MDQAFLRLFSEDLSFNVLFSSFFFLNNLTAYILNIFIFKKDLPIFLVKLPLSFLGLYLIYISLQEEVPAKSTYYNGPIKVR